MLKLDIETNRGTILNGVLFKSNEKDDDIEGYLNYARKSGYKNIILAGHSLGANKVIYYLSRHHDKKNVSHFILWVGLSALRIRLINGYSHLC